ncbi:DUF5797 family protein [Natronomonas salsuginis]|uniref:Uncharacterized protein n=1 Tax=Natronomonas salsuginis TaxID=2217661 RepID=A0A4V5ZPJ1_9EURY|nr:DUF5797 family protein [Natronomonas salsuginis]TKR27983.1 hypothetical protein DM868_02570 [Natronomonas salsuginis]
MESDPVELSEGQSNNSDSWPDCPLDQEELDRLQDIIELAPTSNNELADQWGYESGSDVYQYLSTKLDEYYTRNAEKFIFPIEPCREIIKEMF